MTTFDPGNKTASLVLSNGNLTATAPAVSGNEGGKGTTSKNAGKVMLSFINVTITDGLDFVGVGTAGATNGLADGSQDQAIMIQSGACFSGGFAGSGHPTSIPAAATIDLCIDFAALRFWFRVNGGNWNNNGSANPATNVGGFVMSTANAKFPYVRLRNGGRCTLDPAPSVVPSGFTAWDGAPPPVATAQPVIIVIQ